MVWQAIGRRTGRPPCGWHRPARAGGSWPGAPVPSEPWRRCRGCWAPRTTLTRLVLPRGPLRDLAAGCRASASGAATPSWPRSCRPSSSRRSPVLEARRAYRRLVLRYGEPAPGPGGLRLPPAADRLPALPYHELHPLGLEQRRALTLIRAARGGRAARGRQSPAAARRPWPGCGPSRAWAPGPRPRRPARPSAIPTR